MSMPIYICAIFRNESCYLKEWLEFHLIVGVEKFILYQNNSSDDYHAVLDSYIERGVVELVEWPMPNPSQFAAYQDCIYRYKGQRVWIGFFDCDEFCFSPKYNTLLEALESILADHPSLGALGVNWCCFGSGGQQHYSPAPVIARFTWRLADSNPINAHIKSIVQMNQRVAVGGDPHFFMVERGTANERGEWIGGPFSTYTGDLLRINHYCSKSYDEWVERSRLGKPDRATLEIDPKWYWDRQATDLDDRGEDSIQRYLPEFQRRLELEAAKEAAKEKQHV